MDTVRSISARDPVRFRAGVCQYDEESKQCTPKAAGGTVTIQPSEEAEGFYDFVWRPEEEARGADAIELILIPGETRWVHIQSCKTGRVFCLVFSSGEKYFFWMQERSAEDAGALSEQDRQALARIENALRVAEEGGEEEDVEMADAEPSAPEHIVGHLGDMLPREAVVAHVGALREGSAELRELLALLPEGVRRDRGMLLECVRGPFFTQAVDGLSRQLRAREAAYGLAQALRYPYRGEGVNGFLDGVREQGRRERAERDGAERE